MYYSILVSKLEGLLPGIIIHRSWLLRCCPFCWFIFQR